MMLESLYKNQISLFDVLDQSFDQLKVYTQNTERVWQSFQQQFDISDNLEMIQIA